MQPTLSDPFAGQGKLYYKYYEIHLDQKIGKGTYGSVFVCTQNLGQQKTEICVKIIKRQPQHEYSLQKEIQIIKKIGEKKIQVSNLVKTYEIYEEPTQSYIYFFMEKCDTTLDKFMKERFSTGKRFTSEEIQNLIAQLATGYNSLTQMEIIHRDLKPDNILVTYKATGPLFKVQQIIIKLSDYGAGTIVSGNKQAVTNAGSPFYQAPEVLLQDPHQPKPYTNKCDIYSVTLHLNKKLGIIIYLFCYSTQHIDIKTMAQLKDFLNKIKIQPFKCPVDNNVPLEARQLIESMIVHDENKRISWAELSKYKLFEHIKQQLPTPLMKIIINKNPQAPQMSQSTATEMKQSQQLTKPQAGKIVYNDYEINFDAIIGKGSTSIVYECLRIKTNVKICVKVVQRINSNNKSLVNEINIINQINTEKIKPPYLVSVFEIYEEPTHQFAYIFMERAQSTLTEYMNSTFTNGQRLQWEQLIDIFSQIGQGYNFLFKRNIVHRDLKTDNILVVVNSANKQLFKISDYGCGKSLDNNNQLVTNAGTKFYMAPEISNQGIVYTNKCDVYSLGILFYQLCYPKVLENQIKTRSQLMEFQRSIQSGFKCYPDQFVPPEITQLLERMIVFEPSQRISWDQVYDKIQAFQGSHAQRTQATIQSPNFIKMNNQQRFQTNYYPQK